MKATKAAILETSVQLLALCKQFDDEVHLTDPTKERIPCIHAVTEDIRTPGNVSDRLDRIIAKAEMRKSAYEKLSEKEREEFGLVPKITRSDEASPQS